MDLEISVIVATYNPDYNKLFQTLQSIIVQKNSTFEIIITDDGSKEFNVEKVNNWMKKNKFNDYKIIKNDINRGTTYNVNSAMKIARGKLVKLISPGDFLYDETVLEKIYKYMNENNYDIVFGKAIYYSINSAKEITLYNKCNPLDLKPYLDDNFYKIKKANLFYKDLILGSAFVCNTKLFATYLNRIVNIVKINEDLSYLLMLLDGISIKYWNNYIIWYEYGSGVSTSSNEKFNKMLYNDKKNFFKHFSNEYKESKKIYNIFYGKFQKIHVISKLRRKFKRKFSERKIKKLSECDINDNKIKLIKLLENNDVKGE